MQKNWIFSFQQLLSSQQEQQVLQALSMQLPQWKTHGKSVSYQYELKYNRFLLIRALSETSGCSGDWLNRTLFQLAEKYGLQYADQGVVFFWENQEIHSIPFHEIEDALRSGRLKAKTIVFNHSAWISTGDDVTWQVQLGTTWMARYLQTTPIQ